MYLSLHVKYLYNCHILTKIKYARHSFEKNIKIPDFMKSRPMGADDGKHDNYEPKFVINVLYVFMLSALHLSRFGKKKLNFLDRF